MARLAKIPAVIVTGASCGEYKKCRGHAWNLIYVNNQWIAVDATWNLMSGIVSSSHVYFQDRDDEELSIQYSGTKKTINSKVDFEMNQVK